MKKKANSNPKHQRFPVVVSHGEDGYFIVQCPALPGCATQGRTLNEALKNIKEAIELCLEDEDVRDEMRAFGTEEVSLHTVVI